MKWDYYKKLLEQKLSDSWYNYELAEKKYREAKAIYDATLVQIQSYDQLREEIENVRDSRQTQNGN